MKIQHSTVVELTREVTAAELKKTLDEIPDTARISADVTIPQRDRPWDSTLPKVELHAVWEVEK